VEFSTPENKERRWFSGVLEREKIGEFGGIHP